MRTIPLSNEEKHNGFTHLVVITHEDITNTSASGTPTQTLEAITVAAGHLVLRCATRLVTPFLSASTSHNSTTIEVGDGADPDRFLVSQQLNGDGTKVDYKAGTGTMHVYTAADTVDVKFTGTATTAMSDLNEGEVHIFLALTPLHLLSSATL